MSRAVRKRDLKALVENAQMFCDHPDGDHPPGHCDYLVLSQGQITELLEEAE